MTLIKQYSKKKRNHGFEIIKGKSITIPNESYTIRQILKKFTTGTLPPNIERQGQFAEDANFDSPDLQKINRLDIVDIHRFKENHKEKIEEFNETINYYKDQFNEEDQPQPSTKKDTTPSAGVERSEAERTLVEHPNDVSVSKKGQEKQS